MKSKTVLEINSNVTSGLYQQAARFSETCWLKYDSHIYILCTSFSKSNSGLLSNLRVDQYLEQPVNKPLMIPVVTGLLLFRDSKNRGVGSCELRLVFELLWWQYLVLLDAFSFGYY